MCLVFLLGFYSVSVLCFGDPKSKFRIRFFKKVRLFPISLSHVFLLRVKKISEQPWSNGEPIDTQWCGKEYGQLTKLIFLGPPMGLSFCVFMDHLFDLWTTLFQRRVRRYTVMWEGIRTPHKLIFRVPHGSRPHGHDRILTLCKWPESPPVSNANYQQSEY